MICNNKIEKLTKEIKNIKLEEVIIDKVAPENFYLTTYYPTYYFYNNEWIIPNRSSTNCVVVIENGQAFIKEFRNLKKGDMVVLESNQENYGIYEDKSFADNLEEIRSVSAESSLSNRYELLVERLIEEKNNKGYVVWILGPSVIFDYDTRKSLESLASKGYINCVLAGNAMATHDLEGGYLNTALGQNIYTQENVPMGHYNHLDLLNDIRREGSINNFIDKGNIKDGLIKTLVKKNIPFVLSGSIRDDGPLPEVYKDMSNALDENNRHLEKATLVIGLATMLHSLSASSSLSSYRIYKDKIQALEMYGVDITENVLNKLSASREGIGFIPFATNVQDFVVNIDRLVSSKDGAKNDL